METTCLTTSSAPAIASPCISRSTTAGQARIKLAILECDIPLDKARANYGGYGDIFKLLLRQSHAASSLDPAMPLEDELDITLWNIMDDADKYPRLDDIDAILITGSRKL